MSIISLSKSKIPISTSLNNHPKLVLSEVEVSKILSAYQPFTQTDTQQGKNNHSSAGCTVLLIEANLAYTKLNSEK